MKAFLQKNREKIYEAVKNAKETILQSNFIKSILTLSSGAVFSQVIIALGTPLISRLYSPADIGGYKILSTASSVCCSIGNLGMMTAFMLPEKDKESRMLCKLVAASTAILSFVMCAILFFARNHFRITSDERYSYFTLMVLLWGIGVLVTINNICTAYVNRLKKYKIIFCSQIICAAVNILISAFMGIVEGGTWGYCIGSICAYLCSAIYLIANGNPFICEAESIFSYFKLLRSYKRFLVYSMPANIVMMLSEQVNAQIFRLAFSADILGIYYMAERILMIPTLLIARPINRVFFREASERYYDGRSIGELAYSMICAGTLVAWLPLALITLFGRELFSFFLGSQWSEAGAYASVLGVYCLMNFIDAALDGVFIIIRMNKWNLYIGCYDLVTSLALMAAAILWIKNIYVFLAVLTGVRVVRTVVFKGIFLRNTGVPFSRLVRFLLLSVILPAMLVWVFKIII